MSQQFPIDMGDRDLEEIAALLESSGRFRVLRRLAEPAPAPVPADLFRRGLFVDVETTGLDAGKDTVIELAMVPFGYRADGEIVWVGQAYSGLRDPGFPIPEAVSRLTGITDAAVKGMSIDAATVEAAARACAVVVAHNCAFDRTFCERLWPVFRDKPWACSLKEIDWSAEGFEGAKLGQIAAGFGFYFDSHRAADDCYAGVEILRRKLPRSGSAAFATLLASARRTTARISAGDAPFAAREVLKQRGYRWHPGSPKRPKCWFVELGEEDVVAEIAFLRERVYRKPNPDISFFKLTAYERYSDRILSAVQKVGDRVGSLSARSGKAHHGIGLQASDLFCKRRLP
ncbi:MULTISPECIES: 3'-5' exonuclease [Bradyrhizobium]|uniref:DNA polymerase-3 subunit epsilon n=1 Tax=Bradyrhizobium elkanii TaxID=29448 RepID=A0A8I1Y6U5_BRAEL|nr:MULTISPECIES: 3'-5' exonuclease [Bradyrhizobium]MBP1294332.1 DNA polymerase-3 subunit epsilon [Bradyrhizobium elkanii]MCP1925279.1 DNA polymerase-3 subunit epsilon [Bradyrhizobium elkanii]MCS3477228.1 DNA polymerase-3 subunit epsilon [Bradyrhizobium elkanii]MCS3583965.1 DNA polymerase-3 subunit epsilon [Bradyrhizobium elkanii]MCS3717535.1 DNA polymerase-3 subunit epsilon [Bradyrhizobium elkanii]